MIKIHRSIRVLFCVFFILFTTQAFAITVHDLNAYISDGAITTNIRTKILSEPLISNFKVDVVTVEGVVKLSGTVDSDLEASTLIEIATDTNGVKDVDATKIKIVKSDQALTDLIITAKIKGLFVRYKMFRNRSTPMTILVETHHGKVYLSGTTLTQKQAEFAEEIARSVWGVDEVTSDIEVHP
jgi:osmotically-inducible protein OsmY